jgi:hypothetical protein
MYILISNLLVKIVLLVDTLNDFLTLLAILMLRFARGLVQVVAVSYIIVHYCLPEDWFRLLQLVILSNKPIRTLESGYKYVYFDLKSACKNCVAS